MNRIKAAITGIHAWVPEYILTNHELSQMVDTSDEWIMQRVGISERRILKGEGLGSSDLGQMAVRGLLEKQAQHLKRLTFSFVQPSHPTWPSRQQQT